MCSPTISLTRSHLLVGSGRGPESGCSEQHGVRGERSDQRSGVRLCGGDLPAAEANERGAGGVS